WPFWGGGGRGGAGWGGPSPWTAADALVRLPAGRPGAGRRRGRLPHRAPRIPAKHFSVKNNLHKECFLLFWNRSGTQQTASRMDTLAEGILTRDEMESRRLLAAQDLQRGLSQSEVARKFGVSR